MQLLIRLCHRKEMQSLCRMVVIAAPMFLENECSLLRGAFGLRQVLLQPEEELLVKCNAELSSEGVVPKPKYLLAV